MFTGQYDTNAMLLQCLCYLVLSQTLKQKTTLGATPCQLRTENRLHFTPGHNMIQMGRFCSAFVVWASACYSMLLEVNAL